MTTRPSPRFSGMPEAVHIDLARALWPVGPTEQVRAAVRLRIYAQIQHRLGAPLP